MSRRTALRVVSLAVVAATLTACFDDGFSPYWDHGTFQLIYVNNRPMPSTVSGGAGGARVEVTGGTLTLRRDHSYQMLVHVREWMQGGQFYESTKAFAGTYESDAREIYLSWYDPHYYDASIMAANWRNGRVEVVVPNVDGYTDVLCIFED